MNTKNRIYLFFIFLALIFWNPLSYYLIYGNSNIFSRGQNNYFYLLYSIIFIIGIISIILIKHNKLKEGSKNIVFSISFFGIIFSILVYINLFAGLFTETDTKVTHKIQNSVFEPNSAARYHTAEFDFIANINSIGLRDREINIAKSDKFRILCFGDSWTYGWGVNFENAWPYKLEKFLTNSGFNNIEVINCGRPAMNTTNYKKFMSSYIPLLKPDLVLVGVLQYEDLSQIYTNKFNRNEIFSIRQRINIYFGKFANLFTKYIQYSFNSIIPFPKFIDVSAGWKKTNNAMINKFNHWQNIRFSTFPDTVRNMFYDGDIEPGLLDLYINYPDRLLIFNNPGHPAAQFSLNVMTQDVSEMKEICNSNNAKLIFVNIPMNYFTGHIVIRNPNDLLNDYFFKNNNIDKMYRSVAENNNVEYFELTDHFKNLTDKSNYIFLFDGHPNENGYNEIAKYIGSQLIKSKYIK